MTVRLIGYYCPLGHLHEAVAYQGEEQRSESMLQRLIEEMRMTKTLELACRECGTAVTCKDWQYLDTIVPDCQSLDEFMGLWRDNKAASVELAAIAGIG